MAAPLWQTVPPSASATCLPCCAVTPTDCPCALLMPPFGSPYADYATAETAIADQTSNCIGFIAPAPGDTIQSFVVTGPVADAVTSTGVTRNAGGGAAFDSYVSVSMKAGSVLTVDYDVSSTGVGGDGYAQADARLYKCDGTFIQSFEDDDNAPISGSFVFDPLAEDGEYILWYYAEGQSFMSPTSSDVTGEFVATSDDTMVVSPVIALWDDSGTTRRIEACPRNIDPPCSSFSSLAAAEAELASGNVVDCLGILAAESGVTINSASVSSGPPAVFNFDISNTGASSIANPTLSVQLDAGETVVVSYNLVTNGLSGGGGAIFAEFLDIDCVQLDSSSFVLWGSPVVSPLTGTLVTFTAPYKGRFIIRCFVQSADSPASGTWDLSGSVTLTPSASMDVYPVAVAYLICSGSFPDITCLTCPALLDCT